ncbi:MULTISPECIES: hypothetical protein [Chryseobacterium]|uniref:RES domain-containing protein n=4 Tax=Chryseobacterium TaxID=59732 RepID=A0A448AZI4_CHRGE|nr:MULTISPECIES: hypothetical protein [Chryseobacterium]ASE61586.1 hypothetical protein CEQ15_08810 [Chryseobacterium indologenes]AZB32351.1 hypothetical protein EG351_01005 [Chryseobacterium bernardetii]EFK34122.1 hypothetical protein HMPREF0204_13191 [Chryseobacterium gleum ATCC 35910]QQY30004.1 hypothetical protein I6I60_14060 [Chryseobacterium gleum]TLX26364.1 hypothetical protein FE904_05725 [Chryseobacterium indologenes]
MIKPNWQLKFRDLPEIPPLKRWIDGAHYTKEQNISFRLLQHQEISNDERNDFISLFKFYEDLDIALQKLDYSSFDANEFDNFKSYIDYAFNYIPLMSNKLSVIHTYRLVVNEWVSKKNERLNNISFLKYPPIDIVKSINKYNRANTPNTTVLYTTENIDSALKEIKPPINKLITVGLWKPKEQKELVSYPISHSDRAMYVNPGVQKATAAFEKYGDSHSKLLVEWSRHYFKLLGREFTKPVSHHYEYLISAIFSERILRTRTDPNPSFNFDCIIYPSVGNDFGTDNLAVHPDSVESKFGLFQITEFEVEESYYEKEYVRNHPEVITLAKVKNRVNAKNILSNGDIIW